MPEYHEVLGAADRDEGTYRILQNIIRQWIYMLQILIIRKKKHGGPCMRKLMNVTM